MLPCCCRSPPFLDLPPHESLTAFSFIYFPRRRLSLDLSLACTYIVRVTWSLL